MFRTKLLALGLIIGGLYAGPASASATSVAVPGVGGVQIVPAASVADRSHTYKSDRHGMRCRSQTSRCRYHYNGWYYERQWWRGGHDVGHHGQRYRHRRPGFGYYYGGWWYSSPWWGIGLPGVTFYYDVHRHGQRYHYWRPGYSYRYGGYYYSHPWWRVRHHHH